MKKLIVCGDSFMTSYTIHPGTHFSEIFSKNLQFDLISYARPGFSNGGICVQIETAIKNKPDLILFNTTYPDRIEFALNNAVREDFDIYDIFYNRNIYSSTILKDDNIDKNPIIGTESLTTLLSKPIRYSRVVRDWGKKEHSIREYVDNLYNFSWKQRTDRLQIYATLHRLELSGIPYIFCYDHLKMNDSLPWITKKNDLRVEFDLVWDNFFKLPNRKEIELFYHTTEEEQRQLATFVTEHYQKYF